MIKCCAICKYWKNDTCVNPDQWNTWKTADDTCDDWKEARENGKMAWSDNNM
ncbi:hypothetical protein [uncultured Methanobrevibacter sp.]|uniref:hypothetical protein n=1 Tax=uncultured Methanobrevibacter sp. TaxID=253161 RepID=UPI0026061EEC|nr:hypothetical protein [uncultured Methanobrevibacter sp.]